MVNVIMNVYFIDTTQLCRINHEFCFVPNFVFVTAKRHQCFILNISVPNFVTRWYRCLLLFSSCLCNRWQTVDRTIHCL
jgi:hypothetical protein